MRFRKVGQSFRLERFIVIMFNVRRLKFIYTREVGKERGPVLSIVGTIKLLWMQNTAYK